MDIEVRLPSQLSPRRRPQPYYSGMEVYARRSTQAVADSKPAATSRQVGRKKALNGIFASRDSATTFVASRPVYTNDVAQAAPRTPYRGTSVTLRANLAASANAG